MSQILPSLKTTLLNGLLSLWQSRPGELEDENVQLICHACREALTKRRTFKLGDLSYCLCDYFSAMKELEKNDPESFALEFERFRKGKS